MSQIEVSHCEPVGRLGISKLLLVQRLTFVYLFQPKLHGSHVLGSSLQSHQSLFNSYTYHVCYGCRMNSIEGALPNLGFIVLLGMVRIRIVTP